MADNIIEILISQHNQLRNGMNYLKREAENDSPDIDLILGIIAEFKSSINVHMNMENNIFYPRLLAKMGETNDDLTDTLAFIDKMKVIGEKVRLFITKYSEEEAIKKSVFDFRMELNDMISVLTLRLDSEEQGVYLYW